MLFFAIFLPKLINSISNFLKSILCIKFHLLLNFVTFLSKPDKVMRKIYLLHFLTCWQLSLVFLNMPLWVLFPVLAAVFWKNSFNMFDTVHYFLHNLFHILSVTVTLMTMKMRMALLPP